MKICHLHIGMHKTGSSSIQEYLEHNRHNLGEGVVYANLGSSNHSAPLTYALRFIPERDPEVLSYGLSSERIAINAHKYNNALLLALQGAYKEIIFSTESIVKFNIEELESFKKELLNYVDVIKVYCYVREPKEFMGSAFQQIIKTIPITIDNQQICPNYKSKFEKFEKVFGKVNYRFFSKNTLLNENVVADFCSWLKLPLYEFKSVNLSLGALAVKFLYCFQNARKKIVVSQQSLDLIEESLSQLPNQKLILPLELMKGLLKNNQTDYEWMKQRLIDANSFDADFSNLTEGYGNFLGVFTENEKQLLINLEKIINFKEYVISETGLSIEMLINKPFSPISDIELRIRKVDKHTIVGWALYKKEVNKKVILEFYINGTKCTETIANLKRDDLIFTDNNVGYCFNSTFPINKNDIILIKIGEIVVYSGHLE